MGPKTTKFKSATLNNLRFLKSRIYDEAAI